MPRWGQMSRMAAIAPCDVLQTRIGSPNRTIPFRLPGASSLLRQAGYQKPKSGAFLDGLISVMKSLFIDEEGCAGKGQSGHREYSDMGHATSSQSAPNNCSSHFSSLLVKGVAEAALDCARRTSTVSSCALCEQKGHLAAPASSLTRKRIGYYSKNPTEIATFMRN